MAISNVFAAVLTILAASTVAAAFCYKEGETCEAAKGSYAIPSVGCCKGYECKGKSASGGKSCVKPIVKPTPTPAPKCHKKGERCIGAAGHPRVIFLGCCDGLVCEGKLDWGLGCVKPNLPSTGEKCYKEGVRCIGAPGHPFVPYKECCNGYPCVEKTNDWGKFCTKPVSSHPTPKTTAAPTTRAPPKTHPTAPVQHTTSARTTKYATSTRPIRASTRYSTITRPHSSRVVKYTTKRTVSHVHTAPVTKPVTTTEHGTVSPVHATSPVAHTTKRYVPTTKTMSTKYYTPTTHHTASLGTRRQFSTTKYLRRTSAHTSSKAVHTTQAATHAKPSTHRSTKATRPTTHTAKRTHAPTTHSSTAVPSCIPDGQPCGVMSGTYCCNSSMCYDGGYAAYCKPY
jgi:hypothetical protein